MEELKILVQMVADLPNTAIWVLLGYFTYKVFVVGSVYGVIRYGITALQTMITTAKKENTVQAKEKTEQIKEGKKITIKDVEIDGMCISSDGTYDLVIRCLRKVKNHVKTAGGRYIHMEGAEWLYTAIREKIEREHPSDQDQ